MEKYFLLPVILFFFLLAGCNDDSKQEQNEKLFKQGWQLVSEKLNGVEIDISEIPLPELIYFGEQSVCYLAVPVNDRGAWAYKDTRTAWSYDYANQILNIASLLPVTGYVKAISNNQLILAYDVFTSSGTVDTYEKEYRPAKVKIENLKIRLDE